MAFSLITQPNAGVAPVLAAIRNASKSIDLVMYDLEDEEVESALNDAERRGVAVRVLLNQGYYGASSKSNPNETAYDYFESNEVPVEWTPSYFALTHQKTLIIDGRTAIIMTFNLVPRYYPTSRDFGIIDRDPNDVNAIETAFTNDWQGNQTLAPAGDGLLWSPGSENATVSLIDSAKKSIDVYNEEMADTAVIGALADAARRGITVNVVMTYASEWRSAFDELSTVGVNVRTFGANAALHIHAKMILVDGTEVFIGSENFSSTSLNNNRELGIVLTDPKIIRLLTATFDEDWHSANPFNY